MARTMMNVRLQRQQRRQSVIVLHKGEYPANAIIDVRKTEKVGDDGQAVETIHVTISIPRLFNKNPQGQMG